MKKVLVSLKVIMALFALLLLSGCVTTLERAQNEEAAGDTTWALVYYSLAAVDGHINKQELDVQVFRIRDDVGEEKFDIYLVEAVYEMFLESAASILVGDLTNGQYYADGMEKLGDYLPEEEESEKSEDTEEHNEEMTEEM